MKTKQPVDHLYAEEVAERKRYVRQTRRRLRRYSGTEYEIREMLACEGVPSRFIGDVYDEVFYKPYLATLEPAQRERLIEANYRAVMLLNEYLPNGDALATRDDFLRCTIARLENTRAFRGTTPTLEQALNQVPQRAGAERTQVAKDAVAHFAKLNSRRPDVN